jgi:hypothetical protein
MEEYRSRVYETRVLRRIFRPNREEITGGWKISRSEELKMYALLKILQS